MIRSMTAFARQTHTAKWGRLVWEVRSVNHRYLEISLRLPDLLRRHETELRQLIQQNLRRGKVEATLKFIPGETLPFEYITNKQLIHQLAEAGEIVKSEFPDARTNVMHVLAWPGVLETAETDSAALGKAMFELLQNTLLEIVTVRQREGESVVRFLLSRTEEVRRHVTTVEQQLPSLIKLQRERLQARFSELSIEVDRERLEQEMLWIMQKSDIAEELHRLESHLSELERVLDNGGIVGRRLDFLLQELNREANTLSSKAIATSVTQAAVEMKVAIEQMREQVQNLE